MICVDSGEKQSAQKNSRDSDTGQPHPGCQRDCGKVQNEKGQGIGEDVNEDTEPETYEKKSGEIPAMFQWRLEHVNGR